MSAIGRSYYFICSSRIGHSLARGVVSSLRACGALRKFHTPLDALTLDHAAAVGLMRLWSRIHWSPGDGMMPAEQLLAIYRLAAGWPARGDIVELGAWVGLTTSYLATACQVRSEGKVHAVDTFLGTKEGNSTYPSAAKFGGSTLQAFRDNIARAGVEDVVNTLIDDTADAAAAYNGDAIRLLLIDADHSYEGLRRDYEGWWPHVAHGGLIVFHDYDMPDVARFIDGQVRRDRRVSLEPGRVVANVMAVTKRSPAKSQCGYAPRRAVRTDSMEVTTG